ncbi:MAG TPA: thioesterase family protein [Spirochaetota bacterium]|nr:thioesterase family protein [Spirochaetota bacterium]
MYKFPITIEFEDIDSYGIIHHPKVLYYFERARVHFFIDNGVDLNKLKYGVVLRNLNIQYKIPLLFMDNVCVEVSAKNIEKFRFELDYKIVKESKNAVVSTIELCVIDLETKKLSPIPDEIRVLLEKISVCNVTTG